MKKLSVFREIEEVCNLKPKKTKERDAIIERRSKAKTFKKWLEHTIRLHNYDNRKNSLKIPAKELTFVLKELYKKYNEYNKPEQTNLGEQQGVSSFDYKEYPEIIEVITYVNKKPKVTELKRIESDWIMNFLEFNKDRVKEWNSLDLAYRFSNEFDYNIECKRDYYTDRKFQNYWSIHLRYLRKRRMIEYNAGEVRLK